MRFSKPSATWLDAIDGARRAAGQPTRQPERQPTKVPAGGDSPSRRGLESPPWAVAPGKADKPTLSGGRQRANLRPRRQRLDAHQHSHVLN
jgi:hypothetical protein